MATRYLLLGSERSRFAMSIAGRLEVPSGDSALVGNATQLMPMLLSEWRIRHELSLRSNLAWNTTVGSTNGKFANFQHSHAVVWSASRFLAPIFEVAGSTSTLTGNSELVVQPEVILKLTKRFELKTGLSVTVIPTFRVGIRTQFASFWGKR